MDGIILVNKEKNMTSRDVVNRVCHILNTKKVGHTGTLDPMATGVLVIAINKGLKIVENITALDKEYEAEITLGILTDTLDITGNIIKEESVNISNEDIDKVLESFPRDYDMEVPIYSAVKVNGKKLYEYARNNEEVELPIHKVKIYDLKRISDIKDNKFKISTKVSKGTYIRSLIRDISSHLGTIGIMSELCRVKQGQYSINECYTLNDIEQGNYKIIPIKEALNIPIIEVDDSILKKVLNGNKIDNIYNEKEILFVKNDVEIAIYKVDESDSSLMKPYKVFNISL